MTQHTETPFIVGKSKTCIWSKSLKLIARCENPNMLDSENEANARFIVKACKNHNNLMETLREIKHLIDTHKLSDVVLSQVISSKCFLALSQAEKDGE